MKHKSETELMAAHVVEHHQKFHNPSVSAAQRALMGLAEHHPEKVYAKNKGVLKMSHQQLHDFASTKGLK